MTQLADRLHQLPPYLFVDIDRAKRVARAAGRDIIDLGIGDPDVPTPPDIVASLSRAAADPTNQRYPLDAGLRAFREAIATWSQQRFGVKLNPDTDILPLIGSKEGLTHLPLAFLNPGDVALIPDPAYPAYRSSVILAGGNVVDVPFDPQDEMPLDLHAVPVDAARRAKLLYVNFPNNPTAATASAAQLDAVIQFARQHDVLVVSDVAYSEIAFDGYRPASLLQRPEGMSVGIEFHSCSKTYNMTGWRLGWACGNAAAIAALATVKSNIDSGVFHAIQHAGVAALQMDVATVRARCDLYQERRDVLIDGLAAQGWTITKPHATFYVWAPAPGGDSRAFATRALNEANVVITPGVGFGQRGEGFVRMALTVGVDRLREAVERLRKVL